MKDAIENEAATVKPDLTVGAEVMPLKAVAVMGVRPAPAQESSSIGPAPADLRTLAEAATPGPWQVVTYRTPFTITRYDGTTCSGEHVGRDIATVRHHPQSHAPDPIVTIGIGVTQEPPVPFVHIRPADADFLAAVSPEVVLGLLDAVDQARTAAAPLLRWLDQMEARYGSHPDDIRLAGFADAGVTYGDMRRLRAAIDTGRTDRAKAAP